MKDTKTEKIDPEDIKKLTTDLKDIKEQLSIINKNQVEKGLILSDEHSAILKKLTNKLDTLSKEQESFSKQSYEDKKYILECVQQEVDRIIFLMDNISKTYSEEIKDLNKGQNKYSSSISDSLYKLKYNFEEEMTKLHNEIQIYGGLSFGMLVLVFIILILLCKMYA